MTDPADTGTASPKGFSDLSDFTELVDRGSVEELGEVPIELALSGQ